MKRYVCNVCGYVYDPEQGDPESDIPAGTAFEDLPDDWTCPVCGASKDDFSPEEQNQPGSNPPATNNKKKKDTNPGLPYSM